MGKIQVAIVMGSANDVALMQPAKELLSQFGIASEMRALSAHRSHAEVCKWVKEIEKQGAQVFIAAAGMAAHLAGVIAAQTLKPVLGVPLPGGILDGLDSLLSTVQMPKGTPVATFAVGKAGAVNAALFAVRVLAASSPELLKKLEDYGLQTVEEVLEKDEALRSA